MGLAALPLAEIAAIKFSGPLMITALSVVMLGETVGPRRWVALLVGFMGVLLIVRPGFAAFNLGSVFILISVLFYALAAIFTRRPANDRQQRDDGLLTVRSSICWRRSCWFRWSFWSAIFRMLTRASPFFSVPGPFLPYSMGSSWPGSGWSGRAGCTFWLEPTAWRWPRS